MTDDPPGVYGIADGSPPVLIHLYQGGNYGLEDVVEYFQLGRLAPSAGAEQECVTLVLKRSELGTLKTLADAYSFDYEPEFIEMCYEIQRFGVASPADELRLLGRF